MREMPSLLPHKELNLGQIVDPVEHGASSRFSGQIRALILASGLSTLLHINV